MRCSTGECTAQQGGWDAIGGTQEHSAVGWEQGVAVGATWAQGTVVGWVPGAAGIEFSPWAHGPPEAAPTNVAQVVCGLQLLRSQTVLVHPVVLQTQRPQRL